MHVLSVAVDRLAGRQRHRSCNGAVSVRSAVSERFQRESNIICRDNLTNAACRVVCFPCRGPTAISFLLLLLPGRRHLPLTVLPWVDNNSHSDCSFLCLLAKFIHLMSPIGMSAAAIKSGQSKNKAHCDYTNKSKPLNFHIMKLYCE